MARIPQEEIDRLKQEVDLVALVRSYGVELKGHGENLKGRCPFHDDQDPSLVLTPKKQLWHCLGACDAGGDVYQWVMRAEKVSFRHAFEILNERYGNGSPIGEPTNGRPLESPVDPLADDAEVLRQVVEYYHRRLKDNPAALAYLKERGIDKAEAIDRFKIGYADRTLGLRLPPKSRKAGMELRERLEKLGIFRKKSGHEHLNGCVTFPVFDEGGNVTELYGRRIGRHLSKETPRHLYLDGPHRGVWNMERENPGEEIILCESIIDALTFWCAGYRNVTASYGDKGFTDEHIEAFRRHGKSGVRIAYDRDESGDKQAAQVAETRLIPAGLACYRIEFPRGMDANEYARKVQPASQSLDLVIGKARWMGEGQTPESVDRVALEPAANEAAKEEAAKEEKPPVEVVPPSPEQAAPTVEEPRAVAALPAPLAPIQVQAEVKEKETVIGLGDRRYRIRGLDRNVGLDQLKVNLLVSKGDLVHVDTFDLYGARHREAFIRQGAVELGVEEAVIKKDLAKVLLKLEELQEQQMNALLAPAEEKRSLSDGEQQAALALLKDPKLMDRILWDFEACGVVGERGNKVFCYLACISRKLERPLAVLIQSCSAAGKTSLMDAVLSFVPPEDQVKYSAMTGQSLFYMGALNLKHRILAIAEEEGVEQASYALKLLQSEGQLRIASTGKDPNTGRMETQEYEVEGPVMIFLTTTSEEVDLELANRCIVLSVDEERGQTRAIHESQRRKETIEGLLSGQDRDERLKVHQNAQRLLRPMVVANPYAQYLTFSDEQVVRRRDHAKYLTLIRTITLLHQYQREVKTIEHGGKTIQYIESTLRDIELANELMIEALGRSLDPLPRKTRQLLELLDEIVARRCEAQAMERGDLRLTQREIREETGWSDFQVRKHLRRLASLEYVLVYRSGRGHQYLYELAYDGRSVKQNRFLLGLIDVAKLREQEGQQQGQNLGRKYDVRCEPPAGGFERFGDRNERGSSTIRAGNELETSPPKNDVSGDATTANDGSVVQPSDNGQAAA